MRLALRVGKQPARVFTDRANGSAGRRFSGGDATAADSEPVTMSAAGSDDRLKTLNDELRGQANAQGPWLPLESNPGILIVREESRPA